MQTKKQIVSQFFDDYIKKTVTETETAITIAEESATISAYSLYQGLLKLHNIRTKNSKNRGRELSTNAERVAACRARNPDKRDTTITLNPAVKKKLSSFKKAGETWGEFLVRISKNNQGDAVN